MIFVHRFHGLKNEILCIDFISLMNGISDKNIRICHNNSQSLLRIGSKCPREMMDSDTNKENDMEMVLGDELMKGTEKIVTARSLELC